MLEADVNCWDLHHTLGDFYQLARRDVLGKSTEGQLFTLRPGLIDTLKQDTQDGRINFITTSGSLDNTLKILELSGLTPYFQGVFEGRQIDACYGKKYLPVVEMLGYSEEEAKRRILVTGDTWSDMPVDINLAFICDPFGYRHYAGMLNDLRNFLENLADGNLELGFRQIQQNTNLLSAADIPSNLKATLRYHQSKNKLTIPTIFIEESRALKGCRSPESD